MDHVLIALGGTREERATIIRSLFNSFDAANLGYLDHPQIEAELSALQILPLYKYAKDLMKAIDGATVHRREGVGNIGEALGTKGARLWIRHQLTSEQTVYLTECLN
ncbi:unnamed protein product [Prunus armeniaca]|uniref:Uncharacterized protein n=1 Tax=Prunus armeniaca TaxID=36596 RepID=A0A6J5UBV3_PRUAR|nr:unnamed protein product [Prunus armeniaca]